MRITRAAACLALTLGVTMAPVWAGQTTGSQAALQSAREHLAAGRLAEADAALGKLPPTPESVRLKAEIAVASGNLPRALQAYEELIGAQKTAAPEVLLAIATARVKALREDKDPRVRVDACAALLAAGAHRECTAELNETAGDGATDLPTRLAAARALLDARAPGSERLFDTVVGQAMEKSPAAAADALGQLPAATSAPYLTRLASSDNRDARYIATLALARLRTPEVVPVLRSVAADTTAGAARLVAYIGLAARKDPEAVKVLRDTLPLIKGRERVEAALALTALKDPQGARILEEVAGGEHELLRFDAAEMLYADQRALAERIIAEGLASGNPWIRARAIQAVIVVGMPQPPEVRRAMVDSNPWVAVAATRAALLDASERRK